MHTTPDLVFLDLEETIIYSWSNPLLCNVHKIRTYLRKHNITEIHIFSFAIYNVVDQAEFVRDMKPAIEEALGVTVLSWPSVRDMLKADYELTGVHFDSGTEVHDYITIRGKPQGFINYINSRCEYNYAVLIDDIVPNQTVIFHDPGCRVDLINVTNEGEL